ncbi:MAG: hypothetical protein IH591_12960 [Bacteroidales bacterium]|nr:hypothetical protein [Bacteroidales bacterium]
MNRVFMLTLLIIIISASLEAQEKKQVVTTSKSQASQIVIEKGEIPLVIIDGKKYDSDILRLIDVELIESVEVYKGEEAEKLYNQPSVIVVTTKEKAKEKQEVKIRIKVPEEGSKDKPVIVIDGKVADPGEMESISPESIESVTVLKDEASKKKYNSESGVILIVTKKKD